MDVPTLIRLMQSMEDGSLTPEEARELLQIVSEILDKIVPHVKKPFWRMLMHGMIGTLEELAEHIHDIK